MISRSTFIKNAAFSVAGPILFPSHLAALINKKIKLKNIGLQIWSLASLMEKDVSGTLKMVAQNGYKEVELFGPYPFSTEKDHASWKEVTSVLKFSKSGYFGLSANEFKAELQKNGLSSPSMHVGLDTLRHNAGPLAEAAKIMGQQYAGIAAIPENERKNLDGYKKIADEFNVIGENLKKLGLRFLYHNHGYGFSEMEGKIPFDVIMERTDPALVFFEMDVYWTIAAGADPVKYLDKYPGRYRLMHVKDMTKAVKFSGDGGNAAQWVELFPFITDAGSGILDFRQILAHAKKSGVDHFILENDVMTNPQESLPKGYKFVSSLEL